MKVYIKSATNISDIEAKIAKKQADINKKQAWIQKKKASIEKRMKIVEPAVTPEELAQINKVINYLSQADSNTYRRPEGYSIDYIFRKYNWDWSNPIREALSGAEDDAESIGNSALAIKEAQAVLDKYRAKISALKDKASEIDRIPDCLKTFLDDIVSRWDEHDLRIKNEGKPYYRELSRTAWKILYGDTSSGNPSVAKAKPAELYPDIQESKYSYRDIRRQKFDDEYINIPFERKYGSLKYARSIWDLTDEKIHANNQRDGENLILDLLRRVTKITGPVTDWSELYVTQGNMGAVINGYVIGEDGRAKVESILAGGYAVQRLHVRTLVKPIR